MLNLSRKIPGNPICLCARRNLAVTREARNSSCCTMMIKCLVALRPWLHAYFWVLCKGERGATLRGSVAEPNRCSIEWLLRHQSQSPPLASSTCGRLVDVGMKVSCFNFRLGASQRKISSHSRSMTGQLRTIVCGWCFNVSTYIHPWTFSSDCTKGYANRDTRAHRLRSSRVKLRSILMISSAGRDVKLGDDC